MSRIEDGLIEAVSRVALDEVMAIVVKRMEDVRHAVTALEGRTEDVAETVRALHQLSVGLQRLQRYVARTRDRKVAKLRFIEKWTVGKIAKRTGIERTLVLKMIGRGAKL